MRAFERTGDGSLLALARYFIEERGQRRPEGHYYDLEARARGVPPRPGPGHGPPYSYHQADKPIREIASVEGHAVRAMYVSLSVSPGGKEIFSQYSFTVGAGIGYLGQPASRASRARATAR